MQKRMTFWVLSGFGMVAFFLSSCAPRYVVKDKDMLEKLDAAWARRNDFPKLQRLDYHIPLYAKYLEGVKICLDPGHGGDAHRPRYKRGPTDYREAVMNLKVALYLRDFLNESGAAVKLTREEDVHVSLADRVKIANEWGADIFISLHHNAGPPSVNRNTVWFHRDPDFRPANLDLARYVQEGVADALRLPQVDGAPLKSDQLMFESGFGVLRGLNMVACLGEASFFTHPYEEYRLKQESYLKREAYGYFLGLARYAWRGIPKAKLVAPLPGGATTSKTPKLQLRAITGFQNRPFWGANRPWVMSDSIRVTVNGESVPATFDKNTGLITAKVKKPLSAGSHVVQGGFRNYNGNYAHPLRQEFIVDPPVHQILLSATTEVSSETDLRQIEIEAEVLDRDGLPVLDGTIVHFGSTHGTLLNLNAVTQKGRAGTLLHPKKGREKVRIIAVSEGQFEQMVVDLP